MHDNLEYIGYLKYSGALVEDGYFDAKKAAQALVGFDEVVRYFVTKENPELLNVDFELPVDIKKGSWAILIPAGIAALVVSTYLVKTAEKAATDGFFETGAAKDVKKILKAALIATQWVIKIAQHLGTFTRKGIKNLKFVNNNHEVGIPNKQGDYLYVPIKYFELFSEAPEDIISKNAQLIEQQRKLEIGVFEGSNLTIVTVVEEHKSIFYKPKDGEDIILPELKHGMNVELEGWVTRLNEKTNTLGFEYLGHILTCKPRQGGLAKFKERIISGEDDHFFPMVKIYGYVDRSDKDGLFKDKRPQIVFTEILIQEAQKIPLFKN